MKQHVAPESIWVLLGCNSTSCAAIEDTAPAAAAEAGQIIPRQFCIWRSDRLSGPLAEEARGSRVNVKNLCQSSLATEGPLAS